MTSTITDPHGIHVTVRGEKWFKYFANYQHDGRTFSVHFYARSNEESESVLRSIRTTAIECQQISGEIPACYGAGLFVRTLCFLKNLFCGQRKDARKSVA